MVYTQHNDFGDDQNLRLFRNVAKTLALVAREAIKDTPVLGDCSGSTSALGSANALSFFSLHGTLYTEEEV